MNQCFPWQNDGDWSTLLSILPSKVPTYIVGLQKYLNWEKSLVPNKEFLKMQWQLLSDFILDYTKRNDIKYEHVNLFLDFEKNWIKPIWFN